jgi:hypothetical protein
LAIGLAGDAPSGERLVIAAGARRRRGYDGLAHLPAEALAKAGGGEKGRPDGPGFMDVMRHDRIAPPCRSFGGFASFRSVY